MHLAHILMPLDTRWTAGAGSVLSYTHVGCLVNTQALIAKAAIKVFLCFTNAICHHSSTLSLRFLGVRQPVHACSVNRAGVFGALVIQL